MDGVIILALKKQAYYCAAFNLAYSIKHYNKNINVTLVSDGGHESVFMPQHYKAFDTIKRIENSDYNYNGMFEPGFAKLNINKYSDYDNTLYIDADSLVLQDLEPLLNKLKVMEGLFYSNVVGSGGINDEIHYNMWAHNKDLWSFFKLKNEVKIHTFNTSWFFFRKKSKKVFDKALQNFSKDFGIENLKTQWGGTYPDELFFTGTTAQLNINPTSDIDVMFFGNELSDLSLTELQEKYYSFTLFGGGIGQPTVKLSYIEWYDRLMFSMLSKDNMEHYFKVNILLSGKHINK